MSIRPESQAELDAFREDPQALARVTAVLRLQMLIMQARLYGYTAHGAQEWAIVQLTDAERILLARDAELPDRPLLESEAT